MRRKRAIVIGACALAVVCALGSVLAGGAGASAPRAQLRSFVCQRAVEPADRAVGVTAVMRPLPGTGRMHLRFQLYSKSKSKSSFGQVKGGDLGRWLLPADRSLGQDPGDVWVLHKPVTDLPAPASYYFRVTFRWTGGGHQLGEAVRISRRCWQPELRPDLQVVSIGVKPVGNGSKQDRYRAVIRNAGATGVGPIEVQFSDAGAVQTRTISWLRAHGRKTVTFVGPACNPSHPPTVTVDPTGSVNDYNPKNNSRQATCPAG